MLTLPLKIVWQNPDLRSVKWTLNPVRWGPPPSWPRLPMAHIANEMGADDHRDPGAASWNWSSRLLKSLTHDWDASVPITNVKLQMSNTRMSVNVMSQCVSTPNTKHIHGLIYVMYLLKTSYFNILRLALRKAVFDVLFISVNVSCFIVCELMSSWWPLILNYMFIYFFMVNGEHEHIVNYFVFWCCLNGLSCEYIEYISKFC